MLLFVLVAAAVMVCLVSALILSVCPKRWVVHSDVAARVYRWRTAPPWQVLSRVGKAAFIGVYLGAGVAMAVLLLAILSEPAR